MIWFWIIWPIVLLLGIRGLIREWKRPIPNYLNIKIKKMPTNTNPEEYDDKTLMPFGQFSKPPKGPKRLGDVPAWHLIWLWEISENGKRLSDKKLAAYIEGALPALRAEQNKNLRR